MGTLSFELRGPTAVHALPRQAGVTGASVSLLLHTAIISTLVLIPLLQSTTPPEAAHAMATPRFRPITVTLPPAPRPLRPAPPRSRDPQPAHTNATATTPTRAPDSLNRVSVDVEAEPGPLTGIGDVGDRDLTDLVGGECPPGSLCGPAPRFPDPHPTAVRVGGLIKEPRLLEARAPQYPPIAQAAGLTGRVVLEARVGADGRIREVGITSGHPLFFEAALASTRSRRYEPLLLNGVPTDFFITITIAFNLRR